MTPNWRVFLMVTARNEWDAPSASRMMGPSFMTFGSASAVAMVAAVGAKRDMSAPGLSKPSSTVE